jgi:hypothetical protein
MFIAGRGFSKGIEAPSLILSDFGAVVLSGFAEYPVPFIVVPSVEVFPSVAQPVMQRRAENTNNGKTVLIT